MTLPERQAWALRTMERLQAKAANVMDIRPFTPERENAATCFVIEFLGASDAILKTEEVSNVQD